ncbi:uncharacterized protein MCYG_07202 [Microsporum canis CBS 113480]|uniref:Uncharacterized protein n=1 Tax=Arthroderma otae (strain ATCC MYA-4605 / CBS 113480) TaxID=554155 RepID=C5FXY5_ARTOC|nr:uncharacterized protein MCYG_07202 [Microsporum canis CBS 113480]EEQ34383.1 predicted protein [Microsporum canis CBS 113480]
MENIASAPIWVSVRIGPETCSGLVAFISARISCRTESEKGLNLVRSGMQEDTLVKLKMVGKLKQCIEIIKKSTFRLYNIRVRCLLHPANASICQLLRVRIRRTYHRMHKMPLTLPLYWKLSSYGERGPEMIVENLGPVLAHRLQ